MSSHPGPKSSYTHLAVPTLAVPLSLSLQPGDTLLPALAREMAARGHDSAFLRMKEATARALSFVGPDWPDPEGRRIAWYSETRSPRAPVGIADLRLFFGQRDGVPIVHGHGRWRDAGGQDYFGHILAEQCVLAEGCELTGFALPNARFDVMACTESGFDLFHPRQTLPGTRPDAVLMKLAPGALLDEELIAASRASGFHRAQAHGIGSLVEAGFADGRVMQSRASEFVITEGAVTLRDAAERCDLCIDIVGVEQQIRSGRLADGCNRVLVSAEILLVNTP